MSICYVARRKHATNSVLNNHGYETQVFGEGFASLPMASSQGWTSLVMGCMHNGVSPVEELSKLHAA